MSSYLALLSMFVGYLILKHSRRHNRIHINDDMHTGVNSITIIKKTLKNDKSHHGDDDGGGGGARSDDDGGGGGAYTQEEPFHYVTVTKLNSEKFFQNKNKHI